MVTTEFANRFAAEGVAALNVYDLERVLSHFAENSIIETLTALQLYLQSGGTVNRKGEVRKYWRIGLVNIADLPFEIIAVLTGVNGLTIYYKNKATGRRAAELMPFDSSGKVSKAIVHYIA